MINKPKKLTTRQIKGAETKKKLFKTALRLFSEYGYDVVTVDDIVTAAGISKGTFYCHFKSKNQILMEQFGQIDKYFIEVFKDLDKFSNYTEKLLEFIRLLYQYCANNLDLDTVKIVYASELSSDAKFLNDERRALFTVLAELIDQGQKAGEFREDLSPQEGVKILTRSMRGLFYDWCLYEGKFDLVEESSSYFSRIIGLITKK